MSKQTNNSDQEVRETKNETTTNSRKNNYNSNKTTKTTNSASKSKGRNDRKKAPRNSANNNWYTANTPLAEASVRLPFVWPLGNAINIPAGGNGSYKYTESKLYVPGVCAIAVAPTIGTQANPNSPINVAATTEYAFVRHVNSGSRNYDAVDLMQYNLAVANVYALLGFLMRAYGIARTFSGVNRYIPETLLHAMRITDPDEMLKSLVTVEYQINILIQKMATLAVPNTMPYFNRMASLYQAIYSESDSALSQMYVLIPDGYHRWNTATGDMQYKTVPGAGMTWNDWVKTVSDLVDEIFRSEDCGIISGDILHAYGNNIIQIAPMPADYQTPILHDTVMLNQIKNANIVGAINNNTISVNMTDKTAPFLTCGPKAAVAQNEAYAVGAPIMLQYQEGDDTNNFLFESTRLHSTMDSAFQLITGTEVVTSVFIWEKPYCAFSDGVSDNVYKAPLSVNPTIGYSVNASNAPCSVSGQAMSTILATKAFKYCPVIPIYSYSKSADPWKFMGFNVDIDNYQVLSSEELRRLHETAAISLFNVPLVGQL